MPKPNLDDYITVAERIEKFFAKFPDGSLTSEIVTDDGSRFVVKARAFRTQEDSAPGTGHAEEIRGEGMVNKTSALENAETSAWGRAIAALGFEVKKGVASREEVEQAVAEEKRQAEDNGKPVESRAEVLRRRMEKLAPPKSDEDGRKKWWAECQNKLVTFNAEKPEDLSVEDAMKFDLWLSNFEPQAVA